MLNKPIYAVWTEQDTLLLCDDLEPDDNPIAVLHGGCIGPLSNLADKATTDAERGAYWWGVVNGLRHADNVIRYQSTFGVRDEADDV